MRSPFQTFTGDARWVIPISEPRKPEKLSRLFREFYEKIKTRFDGGFLFHVLIPSVLVNRDENLCRGIP